MEGVTAEQNVLIEKLEALELHLSICKKELKNAVKKQVHNSSGLLLVKAVHQWGLLLPHTRNCGMELIVLPLF